MPGTLNLPVLASGPRRFSSEGSSLSHSFLRRQTAGSAIRCWAFNVAAGQSVIDYRQHASLYEVLRIKQNASPMEIKSAYRSLAKVYHPDSAVRHSSESDDKDFIEIHDAYATLSDPLARAVYDLSLKAENGGRRPFSSSVASNRSPGFSPTRRWETDQCW